MYPKQYGAETAVKHRRQLAFFRILEFGYSKLDFHSDQQETYSFCSHYINTFSSHVDASISIGWNKCQENQLLVTLSRSYAHSEIQQATWLPSPGLQIPLQQSIHPFASIATTIAAAM